MARIQRISASLPLGNFTCQCLQFFYRFFTIPRQEIIQKKSGQMCQRHQPALYRLHLDILFNLQSKISWLVNLPVFGTHSVIYFFLFLTPCSGVSCRMERQIVTPIRDEIKDDSRCQGAADDSFSAIPRHCHLRGNSR